MDTIKSAAFDAWFSAEKDKKVSVIVKVLEETEPVCCGAKQKQLRKDASFLASHFVRLMLQCCRNANRVKEAPFMRCRVAFTKHSCLQVEQPLLGRKRKAFGEGSRRTDQKIVKQITDTYSKEVLTSAAGSALYIAGDRHGSNIFKTLSNEPDFGKKIKKALQVEPAQKTAPERALAAYEAAHFSVEKYEDFRAIFGKKLMPSYYLVRKEMNKCIPEGVKVSGSSAEVPVAALVEHTLKRIVSLIDPGLIKPHDNIRCVLTAKRGGDASSGHARYKIRLVHKI